MARINNVSNFLTDVANAIREKEESTAPIQATTFDTRIANIQAGIDIDGIIKEYEVATGENVSIGDFVTFINEIYKSNSLNSYSSLNISAVALDENTVFIAYSHNDSYQYLYGIVCTILNNTITTGTETLLFSGTYTGYNISAVALDENRVFIAHNHGSDNTRYYLYATLCTISGTTITVDRKSAIVSSMYAGRIISAVALDENRVFIAHSFNGVSYLLNAVVCTISGTNITVGTDKTLFSATTSNVAQYIYAIKVADNRVFIAHNNGTSTPLYGVVCNISGTSVYNGSDIVIDTTSNTAYNVSITFLSLNKILIIYRDPNYSLYGVICNISDYTFTLSSKTQLTPNATSVLSCANLKQNNILMPYYKSGDTTIILAYIITISNSDIVMISNKINLTTDIKYTINQKCIITLSDNNIFMVGTNSSNSYLISSLALINKIKSIKYTSEQINRYSKNSWNRETNSTSNNAQCIGGEEMARSDNLSNFCTDVAIAIKNKLETTEPIYPSQFDTKIRQIQTGVDIQRYYKRSTSRWCSNSRRFC